MAIRELIAQTIEINPNDNIITLKGYETNLEYAQEEFNWYLSGTNKIAYSPKIFKIWCKYSDDGIHARSAYGHKIFSTPCQDAINQWDWIIDELQRDSDTRRAIININSIEDKNHISKDIPCTIALQYFIRQQKLFAITYMRSNDAYYGFRNDVYCFCELQKLLAQKLNITTGAYFHVVGSLHLYESTIDMLKKKGVLCE
jgi:thymidylate synthase